MNFLTNGVRKKIITDVRSSGKYPTDLEYRIISDDDLRLLRNAKDGVIPIPIIDKLWKELTPEEGEIENRFIPRPVVYISSPYTIGDTAANVKMQIDVANTLIENGFAPIAPLLSHFQHMIHPQHYTVWLNLDKTFVSIADCILRLPGKSTGANIEVAIAKARGIPVYYNIEDLLKAYENNITLDLKEEASI